MRAFLFAVLCLALVSCASTATRHRIDSDRHPLALWSKSTSSPRGAVLLIHGRTWSALPNFDLQVRGENRSVMDGFVRAGYSVYALDLRGYGATARDASGWLTPHRAVEDVRAALEWIAREHAGHAPALIGYSRGASVAMLTAQRYPTAMSAVVLYGLPATAREPAPAPDVPPREPTTATAAASDFITPGAASRNVIDAYVAQALASDPVRTDWRDEEQIVYQPEQIRAPTLFLYGARDPRLAPDAVLKLYTALGTADRSWVTLPDSDHAAHVENVQPAWLHAIISFIERPRG